MGAAALVLSGCAGTPGNPGGAPLLGAAVSPTAQTGQANPAPLGLTRDERLQTAKFVEGLSAYRTSHDNGAPILRHAGIRGPLDRAAPGQAEQTYYCVSAEIGDEQPSILPIGGPRTQLTSLELVRSRRGRKSGFQANAIINQPTPPECQGPFEPFPELEQVRNERRAAMGLPAAAAAR